jgi:hypothetical protein
MIGEDALAAGALALMLAAAGVEDGPVSLTGGPPFGLMATTLQPLNGPLTTPQRPQEDRPQPAPKGAKRNAGR